MFPGNIDDGLPTLSVGDKTLTWSDSTSTLLGAKARSGELLHGQGTLVFEVVGLQNITATLPLHLSIPLFIDNYPFFAPEPLPTSVVPGTHSYTPTPVPLSTLLPSFLQFAFSMTMPFDSRHTVLHIGQTVESGDVAITLEQMDITPSEARMMLRYSPTKPNTFLSEDDWTGSGSLYIVSRSDNNSTTLSENPEDEEYPADHGCHSTSPCVLSYLDPPFPSQSPLDYTLTFTANLASPLQGPWSPPPPLGTWVFRFNIPASSK